MKNVICYINQFFAGIDREDKADHRPEVRDGVMGPTVVINQMLAEIDVRATATTTYNDNFMNIHRDEAIERILTASKGEEFDLLLAGSTFQAGRYDIACSEIRKTVSVRFGAPVITFVHAENPGVETFKRDMYIMMDSHSAASMKKDTGAMVKLADELLKGRTSEGPDAEGYYARGIRRQVWCEDGVAVADHAMGMLIAEATGQPYQFELIIPKGDPVSIAPTLEDLKHAKIVLVDTGDTVSMDNPDRIQFASVTRWGRYSISRVDRLRSGKFKTIHADFDLAVANTDPNIIMPVDTMREFLDEGKYDSLHDYPYPTVRTGTAQGGVRRVVKGIIPLLEEDHVDAVIMVSI